MAKEKKFDAIKFTRKAREKISRDIAGMTLEEELEYHRKHSEWINKPLKNEESNIILRIMSVLFPKSEHKIKNKFWGLF